MVVVDGCGMDRSNNQKNWCWGGLGVGMAHTKCSVFPYDYGLKEHDLPLRLARR